MKKSPTGLGGLRIEILIPQVPTLHEYQGDVAQTAILVVVFALILIRMENVASLVLCI